jgi:hypothetical protein
MWQWIYRTADGEYRLSGEFIAEGALAVQPGTKIIGPASWTEIEVGE